VTEYGLDGPRIESRWGGGGGGGRFFAYVQTGSGPTQPPVPTGSFPGVKWLGRGADHPPPSSAEVENE
jgi:hypothetical protein